MIGLVFDIGGTKTRIARTRGTRLNTPTVYSTPKTFSGGMRLFASLYDQLFHGQKFDSVAGCIAASLDVQKSKTILRGGVPGWHGKPLRREIERIFHCPVHLENDGALVGLGEALHGAGRGYSIVAYITMSTGVGGARIVHKTLDSSAFGFEPGKMYVSETTKTWNYLTSGAGILQRFGQRPEFLHNKRTWKRIAFEIALGCINVAFMWSPDIIVIGGSVMKSVPLRTVRRVYQARLRNHPYAPAITRAKLGDFGGLYGAMELARRL